MVDQLAIASMFAGVNVILLGILSIVWIRNYQRFQTAIVLGLTIFGIVLLTENLVALYYFITMESLYAADPTIKTLVSVLRGLQMIALGALAYATLR